MSPHHGYYMQKIICISKHAPQKFGCGVKIRKSPPQPKNESVLRNESSTGIIPPISSDIKTIKA